MSFTTYYIPDTFAEKQDMDPILKQQLLAFILGGSFLSTITGFVTLKYTKKQAEAKALYRTYIKSSSLTCELIS